MGGKTFHGKIKADGIYGLIGVKGTLSFEDGFLIWSAKGSHDKIEYSWESVDGGIKFYAKAPIGNGETIEWSGVYDGKTIINVKAAWTRQKGDFIHDLLLPDVLTLTFTPNDNH